MTIYPEYHLHRSAIVITINVLCQGENLAIHVSTPLGTLFECVLVEARPEYIGLLCMSRNHNQ